MVKKGEWVSVHCVVLPSSERAPQVPDDTKTVPLEMWTKGYLCNDAEIGDNVEVVTRVGRVQQGELVEVNPCYKHDFGNFVPELNVIGDSLRAMLDEYEEDQNE